MICLSGVPVSIPTCPHSNLSLVFSLLNSSSIFLCDKFDRLHPTLVLIKEQPAEFAAGGRGASEPEEHGGPGGSQRRHCCSVPLSQTIGRTRPRTARHAPHRNWPTQVRLLRPPLAHAPFNPSPLGNKIENMGETGAPEAVLSALSDFSAPESRRPITVIKRAAPQKAG